MERYKLVTVCLSEDDIEVLRESLWHAVQRGDIPDEDRACAHVLREQLGELDAH